MDSLEQKSAQATITEDGYVLNVEAACTEGDKTTQSGQQVLIPQPSDSPNDPLNWSSTRKHVILFIISWISYLPDSYNAMGGVILLKQTSVFDVTPEQLTHVASGAAFMVGAGGPFVVALSAYFGRLPVLFWFMVVATATMAWSTSAHGFDGYFAARVLASFFSTVAQGGGMMFIRDMFFLHEHARKINIWQAAVIVSPFLGPMLASFMVSSQPWWAPVTLETAQCALGLVLVALFVKETYYNRTDPNSSAMADGNHWLKLIGVHQRRIKQPSNTFLEAVMRPIRVAMNPVVLLIMTFVMLQFAWNVGIDLALGRLLTQYYNLSLNGIGFFFFFPVVGTIFGEVIGHWLHDMLARAWIAKHDGRLHPEARLLVLWIALPLEVIGLLMFGFGFQYAPKTSYWIPGVGYAVFVAGNMFVSVGTNAYLLAAYPEASGETAAWINFARTLGGFIVAYFEIQWGQTQGWARTAGAQAGICVGGSLCILILQSYGRRLRKWTGLLHLKTI